VNNGNEKALLGVTTNSTDTNFVDAMTINAFSSIIKVNTEDIMYDFSSNTTIYNLVNK
jgi:hypothetical protein